MAYFTAVLTPGGDGWRPVDVDVETGSPDELGDVLRSAVDDEATVLAVLEREDEWFAFARTESDDTRLFVSDAVAASGSSYAELFADLPPATEAPPRTGSDEETGEGGEEGVTVLSPTGVVEAVWAGDPGLLEDLGCPAAVLIRLALAGTDPSAATVEVGELLGLADVLESLR